MFLRTVRHCPSLSGGTLMRFFCSLLVHSFAVASSLLCLTSASCGANPVSERQAMSTLATEPRETFRKNVVRLLVDHDYEALDAGYDALKDGAGYFPNGNPKLAVFYETLLTRGTDGNVVSDDGKDTFRLERSAALRSWLESRPDSVAARVSLAMAQEKQAWELRGHDYADQLTPWQEQGFLSAITGAVETVSSITQWDPEAYGLLIDIATETGMPQDVQDGLFHRAASAYPDYPTIYVTRTTALLPKWGGSSTAICDLADSLANSSSDIAVLDYSVVAETMVDSKPKRLREIVEAGCLDWSLVKASFDRRAAVRGLNNFDGNMYLAFSAVMGDRDAARRAAPHVAAYDARYWIRLSSSTSSSTSQQTFGTR